jgi:hypothetical protein
MFKARKIDKAAHSLNFSSIKVARIHVARDILDIGLKEAKAWVEDHFEDSGRGPRRRQVIRVHRLVLRV